MKEAFTFYRALDPVKGSWDGYGLFPIGDDDFLVFVADAPSGASIQTPEMIKDFWAGYCRDDRPPAAGIEELELADAINRLQNALVRRGRLDGANYQATLALARKSGSSLLCFSAGDSVLQLHRGGRLYRLTSAEVWDGALVIDAKRQLTERQRTTDIAFIGASGRFVRPQEIFRIPLIPGDSLLLHTDGLEDLLPPDRLLSLYEAGQSSLQRELENIFQPDKLKDDVTLVTVEMEIPEPFRPQAEIAALRPQIEAIADEQAQFRDDLAEAAVPASRLDKIERNLKLMSEQLEALGRKLDSAKKAPSRPAPAPARAEAARGPLIARKYWYTAVIVLLALIAGTTFLYLLNRKPMPKPDADMTRPPATAQTPEQKTIAPPEIPPGEDCTYVVERGDTLEKVAAKKRLPLELLLSWNQPLQKNSKLKVGQKLNTCGVQP